MTETQPQIPSTGTDSRTDSRPRAVHGADTLDKNRSLRQRISTEDRGQSELLGAILLFGLAIAVLVLIQVAAVPAWNQAIEFEHNQRLNEDLQQLGQTLSDVAADGGDRSATVELGVRYPTRPFLFNPGPATGSIETTAEETVTIENSQVNGSNGYWNQTSMSYTTRSLEYDSSYNEYRDAPETTYEYGTLVREFPNGYNTTTQTVPVVEGTNINLFYVNGRLSETASDSFTVPVEGTSAPTTGVKLSSPDGNPIEITLPTEYPNRWANQLNDEPNVVATPNANSVTLELDGSKTYNLRMARLEVGPSSFTNDAEYITAKGDPTKIVARNTSNELTVVVRDQFNNPVAGEDVSFAITGGTGATLQSTTATSGEDGEASVFIETLDDSTVTVEATIDGGSGPKTEEFTVEVVEGGIRSIGDGDGPGAEDGVSSLNPETIALTDATLPGGNKRTTLTFDNNLNVSYRISEMRVSYYFNGQQTPPSFLTYTGDGTTLDIGQVFDSVSAPTLNADGNSGEVQTITLDLSDAQGSTWNTDFFVLSVKFSKPSGETTTYSYLIAFQ